MLPHYIISVLVIENSAPVCAGVPTARELYISLSLHIAVLSASLYLNPNLTSSGTLPVRAQHLTAAADLLQLFVLC
jgi:hypothetical protein